MINPQEPLPESERGAHGTGMKSVRIPVEWSSVGFECGIKILAQGAESVPSESVPVRLRVSQAVAGSCRLEIFCRETGLCGASAGYWVPSSVAQRIESVLRAERC